MYQAPGNGYNPQFGMQQPYPAYQPAWSPNNQNANNPWATNGTAFTGGNCMGGCGCGC